MSMYPSALQHSLSAVERGVVARLDRHLRAIQPRLPGHMTPERMCRLAVRTLDRAPWLWRCTPRSLAAAFVEAAALGLEIDMCEQAFLVSRAGTAMLIPGYRGLMDLACRSGRITSMYADTVHENDAFTFRLGLSPVLEHTPSLENRGGPCAVYAVARLRGGGPLVVVLGKADVERARAAFAAPDTASSPWHTREEEMWKTTAIRRLYQYLPLSPAMRRALTSEEAAESGSPRHPAEPVIGLPPQNGVSPVVAALNAALLAAVGREEASAPPDAPRPDTPDAPDRADMALDIPTIPCPRKGGEPVSDDDCFYCALRKDCDRGGRGEREERNAGNAEK